MRVHRLEITAFGPFAGTEILDFEPLNDAGVFLLTGRTGAGKTSVLDAVCFALFGQVPGVRDKAKAYRSHHAGPEGVPRVVLEVSLQGRRFRLTRQAAWSRPSRRARSGFVEEAARASAQEWVDGGWVPRSGRIDEVGHLVTRLLGLTRDQFCQVVLLPQGDFQAFLRAGGHERQRILETLFGTQRFQAVERWLKEHRAEQTRRCREHGLLLQRLVARLEEVCGGQLPVDVGLAAGLSESGAGPGLSDWQRVLAAARELVDVSAAGAAEAARDSTTTAEAAKRARHLLDEAAVLAERQQRHHDAERALTTLLATRDLDVARHDAVRLARAATPLMPLIDIVTEADIRLATVVEASQEAASACDAVGMPSCRTGRVSTRALERATIALRERLGQLSALQDVEAECDRLRDRIEAEEAARPLLIERLTEVDAWLLTSPGLIAEARTRLDALVAVVARIEDCRAAVRHATFAKAAAHEVARLDEVLTGLRAHRLSLREAAADAQERWLDARECYLAGVAADLAATLRPGSPCPVCGSEVHPNPTAVTGEHVSRDEEQALFGSAERARDRLAVVDRDVAAAENARSQSSARSNGVGLAEATEVTDSARATLEAVEAAIDERKRISAELEDLVTAAEQRRAQRESVAAELAGLDTRLSEGRLRLSEQQGQVERAVGVETRIADAVAELSAQAQRSETLLATRRAEVEARQAAADARSRLATALTASVFETAEAVRVAALADADIARAEALCRAHDSELAGVRRTLCDPHLSAAAQAPAPDLDALEAAAQRAAQEAGDAAARTLDAEHRLERLEALTRELDDGVVKLAPLLEAKALADAVAGLCTGTSPDNVTRTALSHYVLASRLGQVVAAANLRLSGICNGRYRLEHRLARDAGDNRGGLGLLVADTHTGVDRDPATLSGGEAFYVSLSLALGLADVVCHEAGGVELSTLFIDEGFGSLDDETRDEVLDELDELRAGGRVIGLVSHLSELRARFPVQLHVVPSRHGSTCLRVSAPEMGSTRGAE
jgi:exonuclease SbcC